MRTARRLLTCSTFAALLAPGTLRAEGTTFIGDNGGAATPPCLSSTRQQPPQSGARLVDEFGDIQTSDWLARLDYFANDLNQAPGATALIVAYGVPNNMPGWPPRRANWAMGYLIKGRGVDASRVRAVYGGHRDKVTYQHWLIPPGSPSPVPDFDFAAALTREKSAYKFDRFFHDSVQYYYPEGDYSDYLSVEGRYEPLVLALRGDPAARACIIAYASHKDRRGTDRTLAARHKRALMSAHSIGAARVVAFGGGAREYRAVEFWVVPPGSPLPKPTPQRPPRRAGRRGRR
jgi:hypothetical protein